RFTGPPSPNYIPGPEEPQSPPPPDFVLEPVYPEFMPPEDEILPNEEQPLPAADSPTTDSPGYIPESDPEEDPEEDDDEDPKEDLADYPADGGDDGDDEDEPSNDDEDEEVDIKVDDEEEEEHPAPADSTAVALPAIDQASSAEETEPFETDESAVTPPPLSAYRITARIYIPAPVPTPVWSDAEVSRLLTISTPPSSPLSPWLGIVLGLRYEVGESSSAAARPARGLRADYGFVATMDREIRRDLERDVGYRITDSWDEIVEAMQGTPVSEQQLMAGQLNMLYRDRRAHARTARLMETAAKITAGSDYRATGSKPQEVGGDYRDASGRSQEIEAIHKGTEATEEASDSDDRKMAPKRRTMRLNLETKPATTAATTTTVTNAQLHAMIDQGVTAILAARDANTNGVDSHN
ncbi:hypothetical protein Tco_1461566, partial [Tanacetum coccineum]